MWGMQIEWANEKSAIQRQDCFSYRSSMVVRRQLMAFPLGRSLAQGGRLQRAEGGRRRDNIGASRGPASYRIRKRRMMKTES